MPRNNDSDKRCRRAGRISILLFVFIFAGYASVAFARQHLLFDHLTVKQGLSQGDVNCIFQDSKGFLWFGTQDGLNRYDGYEFKIYRNDPQNPSTISGNFIALIAEDSTGTLWFGIQGAPAILNKFDRVTEKFLQVRSDSVNLANARVSANLSNFIDPAGVRWSGTLGQGLTRFDPRTGKTTTYRHDPANPSSLANDKIYSVLGDKSGNIWVGTLEGLDRLDEKSGAFTHFRHDDKDPNSLSDNYVWPILEDRDGVLWVGTFRGGLNRFDRVSGTFSHFRPHDLDPRSLGGDRIYSLYQDNSGTIWVGTGEHGVDHFNPSLTNFDLSVHDPATASIADNDISGMYVSRTGLVWIGTDKGLNCWDRKVGKYTLYQHDAKNPRSIGDNIAQSMLEDRTGTLWVGTVGNGLDRFDNATGTFTHFRNNPSDPTTLPDNRVYALCEDQSGDIWVGTYAGGLCRFDKKTGSFRIYRHSDSTPTSLAANGAWALLADREGQLWVGTFMGGLDRFNRETETFTHFAHSDTNPQSLSDNIVLTLFEDRKGAVWIGTSNGLNRFDKGTGTFRSYTEKDGLPNATIFGILEDRTGKLWMSTNKGLSRFDPDNGQFHNFDYSDGLQGNEFNQSAYAQDPNSGEMFFGGPNGFNMFQPEKVKLNSFIPPIVFTSFTRYNADDKAGKPIREIGVDAGRPITLSYKDNVVNFEFAALSFYNNFKNQYAYRLEGYNEGWIQLGTERRATFTNLDGGSYVLHVKGTNSDGIWNDEGTALAITVNPPWWKTRWAYGSYFSLFVVLMYFIRRVEINRREQKARIRESELTAKAALAEKRALEAENERKSKELNDARVLQLSMLPQSVPQIPGYAIAVFMKVATEVGGDYYDFNVSPEGDLNIAFGDATGHGMQAGTIVTLMKGLFISESSKFEIPAFFNRCSRAMKEIKLGRLFMALTLARFRGKSVSLSSAGMPPVYLYRKADGTIEEILLKAVPLGSMKNFPYSLYETELNTGDAMLFITDGLPEQKNSSSEMFDYARVIDCLKSTAEKAPGDVIDRLMSEGENWMSGAVQDDDITLLVIKKIE
jgi:ligand-binding sensor domain-containing protein/serine phosphatase RsbU (regulator of sigma subunit)